MALGNGSVIIRKTKTRLSRQPDETGAGKAYGTGTQVLYESHFKTIDLLPDIPSLSGE